MIPTVSILLATYNGAKHIEEQIASIAAQQNVEISLLIRDDESSDATVSLALAAAARYQLRVRVIEDELGASGSAGANFLRLLSAPGAIDADYVAFSDQDDIWHPDKLAAAIRTLSATGADGYSSDLCAVDDDMTKLGLIIRSHKQRKWDYLFQGASAGCTYVLTKSGAAAALAPLNRPGPPPAWASHDWYIYACCRNAGLRWVQDSTPHIFYRQHDANVQGARTGLAGLRSRLRQIRSGWYFRHIHWIADTIQLDDNGVRIVKALKRYRVRDRLWLAVRASEFRRDLRGRMALIAMFLVGLR